MFVTVWLGILNLKTGLMRCANAGHEYPAIRRADGDYELLKDKHGMILAEFENIKMKEYEVQLEAGDQVFVYTDGVPEAVNEKLEQYGTDRMIEKLNKLKILYPQQILESMLRDIRNFAGAAEQFDDITMLGFTYNGNKETIG
jgi:serine phosphatase RsbU (regulator of sigma subunit)